MDVDAAIQEEILQRDAAIKKLCLQLESVVEKISFCASCTVFQTALNCYLKEIIENSQKQSASVLQLIAENRVEHSPETVRYEDVIAKKRDKTTNEFIVGPNLRPFLNSLTAFLTFIRGKEIYCLLQTSTQLCYILQQELLSKTPFCTMKMTHNLKTYLSSLLSEEKFSSWLQFKRNLNFLGEHILPELKTEKIKRALNSLDSSQVEQNKSNTAIFVETAQVSRSCTSKLFVDGEKNIRFSYWTTFTLGNRSEHFGMNIVFFFKRQGGHGVQNAELVCCDENGCNRTPLWRYNPELLAGGTVLQTKMQQVCPNFDISVHFFLFFIFTIGFPLDFEMKYSCSKIGFDWEGQQAQEELCEWKRKSWARILNALQDFA